jgi:hypothetical protein
VKASLGTRFIGKIAELRENPFPWVRESKKAQ